MSNIARFIKRKMFFLFVALGVINTNISFAGDFSIVLYADLIKTEALIKGVNIKVWSIKKDDHIRINLVEFNGLLGSHKHPDAAHSLMILDGEVVAIVSEKDYRLIKGDFISIPKNAPHSYKSITANSVFVSMDAPYYDPNKTFRLD
ncbi:MAG: cupin domain-containing protein [Bdellovibrionaceae bacterium]|nr:cupin domain-containing protein [Pseudobdellovibrionaceae bacterium]